MVTYSSFATASSLTIALPTPTRVAAVLIAGTTVLSTVFNQNSVMAVRRNLTNTNEKGFEGSSNHINRSPPTKFSGLSKSHLMYYTYSDIFCKPSKILNLYM